MKINVNLMPALPQHAAVLVQALGKSRLDNFSFFEEPVTEEREREYLERVIKEASYLYLIINQQNRVVGTTGLHEVDKFHHTARIGMTIFNPDDQHHGYGRQAMHQLIDLAFGELGMHKLYANIIAHNHEQIKWDQSFGFRFEGYLAEEYLLRGQRYDMVRLALLKSEWLKHESSGE